MATTASPTRSSAPLGGVAYIVSVAVLRRRS